MGFFMSIKPIRVQFKTACELLDISREALRHKVRTDASPECKRLIQNMEQTEYSLTELMALLDLSSNVSKKLS